MIGLKKFVLDHSKSFSFFEENLKRANTLSTMCLKYVNFEEGSFFTFLPASIEAQKIHAFSNGGTNSNLHEKISSIITNKMNENYSLSVVFDDTIMKYKNGYKDEFFLTCGSFYQDEIYYILNYKKASPILLDECLSASFDGFWHSLCLLTLHNFEGKKMVELDKSDLKSICEKATTVIVGAYDAEGYVFWEKHNLAV